MSLLLLACRTSYGVALWPVALLGMPHVMWHLTWNKRAEAPAHGAQTGRHGAIAARVARMRANVCEDVCVCVCVVCGLVRVRVCVRSCECMCVYALVRVHVHVCTCMYV